MGDNSEYGSEISFSLPVEWTLQSAVTPRFLYVGIAGFRKHCGENLIIDVVPPAGFQILVAIPRPNKEVVDEEMREGAILLDELLSIIKSAFSQGGSDA